MSEDHTERRILQENDMWRLVHTCKPYSKRFWPAYLHLETRTTDAMGEPAWRTTHTFRLGLPYDYLNDTPEQRLRQMVQLLAERVLREVT